MAKSAVYCAIDRANLPDAQVLASAVAPHVDGLKLGLEFFVAQGAKGVALLQRAGRPIFLDLKLHDIPNTVAGAIRAVGKLGVRYVTVHASGGAAMLRAAKEAAANAERPPQILAVTVLTSLDAADLTALGVTHPPDDQVTALAEMAVAAGADGLVCSPMEVAALRQRVGNAVTLVVPGVRPSDAPADDQKRTLSPAAAQAAGADVLVVGRPITAAIDPAAAARTIVDELTTTTSR
ncbi:MAG: orotidine-5'-phosphate decarboxylase [Pseudomonadota bacterium]